jgi:DNA repair protein RadC
VTTERKGRRAPSTSKDGLVRFGPRVRVMLVRDIAEATYNRTIASGREVDALLRDEVLQFDRERFLALLLNAKNKLLGIEEVSTGSLSASIVHPRELFKAAILANAAAVICVHNHPSGDPSPSPEDRRITEKLRHAAEILGIPLLDHVVIGNPSYYSFADNGW